MRDFTMWWFVIGILIAIFNGFVRKLEADGLLGFAWILFWPLTPIGYIAKGIEKFYKYQPIRRLRIYF